MPGPMFWLFPIVGLATLAVAARFAFHPAERTLGMLRPLSAATVSSTLAAVLIGTANLLGGVRWAMERAEQAAAVGQAAAPTVVSRMVLGGAVESLATLGAGAALMTVVWVLVAVGLRRQN